MNLQNSFTADAENVHHLLEDKHPLLLAHFLRLCKVFLDQCWQQSVQYCDSRTVTTSMRSNILAWTQVLLVRLFKKFPAFYETRRFVTVFTTARHWTLSWIRLIQSTLLSLIYACDFHVVISPQVSRPKLCTHFSHLLTYYFYFEGMLFLHPIDELDGHRLSAVRDCLFILFADTLHLWAVWTGFSNLRIRGPLKVDQPTDCTDYIIADHCVNILSIVTNKSIHLHD
jgi:hypothetical protein